MAHRPALLQRHRRRDGGDDIAQLVASLGDAAAVPAFYDVRRNVTVVSGAVAAWDDARGVSGFGPQLANATTANRPVWDATNLLVGFTAASSQELHTAVSSRFDLSGNLTVVWVGTMEAGSYAAAVADSTAANRLLAARTTGSNIGAVAFPGNVSATTAVLVSTTRRVAFATNAGTTLKAEVPTVAAATATITAIGAGNNALTLGTFFTGASSFFTGKARAVLVLAGAYTTAQRDTIAAWATAHHGAGLA